MNLMKGLNRWTFLRYLSVLDSAAELGAAMSSQAEILSASVDPDGAVQFHLTCSGNNMCLTWTANGRWHLGGRGFLSIRDAAVILGHSDEWFLGLLAGALLSPSVAKDRFFALRKRDRKRAAASRKCYRRRLRDSQAAMTAGRRLLNTERFGLPGFIYFFQRENRVKIGWTTRLNRRYQQHYGSDVLPLIVLGVRPAYREDESRIHAMWDHLRNPEQP